MNFATANGSGAAFSVEAWVNGGYGQYTNGGIVALGYGSGGEQFALQETRAANHDYRFFVRNAAGTPIAANGTNAPSDTAWHHVVGVCDQPNGQAVPLRDGIQTASAAIGATSGLLNWKWPA